MGPNQKVIAPLLIILGLIVSGAGGFYLGQSRSTKTPLSVSSPFADIKGFQLFQTQTATIVGKIVRIDPSNRVIVQDAKGQSSDFAIIPTVLISKPVGGKSVASQSGGIKNLELNQDALITLVVRDREYVITAISYLPPVPSFPATTTTGSAKLK